MIIQLLKIKLKFGCWRSRMAEMLNPGKAAKQNALAQQRTQMAQLAKQQADATQPLASGGRKRGAALLDFSRNLGADNPSAMGDA
jgi:hypothetical protein